MEKTDILPSDVRYILFDLDGTLTDPQEGITNSVAYALEKFGIRVKDRSTLNKFIGPPLKESFMEYYQFSSGQAEEAVWKYREYFHDRGIFENKVYPGIPGLLAELSKEEKKLILATSKPTVYARRILEHFNLDGYFTDIQGSELDGSRTKKEDVITQALLQNHISDKSEAVMVGDRMHDVLGAKKCALASVGVLFGYGGRAELEECGADWIVDSVRGLRELLTVARAH